jgi:hypothetical protein
MPAGQATSTGKDVYKGVAALSNNRWKAQICYNSKTHHLGTFISAKEAALAYDNTLRGNNPHHPGVGDHISAEKAEQRCNFVQSGEYRERVAKPIKRKRTANVLCGTPVHAVLMRAFETSRLMPLHQRKKRRQFIEEIANNLEVAAAGLDYRKIMKWMEKESDKRRKSCQKQQAEPNIYQEQTPTLLRTQQIQQNVLHWGHPQYKQQQHCHLQHFQQELQLYQQQLYHQHQHQRLQHQHCQQHQHPQHYQGEFRRPPAQTWQPMTAHQLQTIQENQNPAYKLASIGIAGGIDGDITGDTAQELIQLLENAAEEPHGDELHDDEDPSRPQSSLARILDLNSMVSISPSSMEHTNGLVAQKMHRKQKKRPTDNAANSSKSGSLDSVWI